MMIIAIMIITFDRCVIVVVCAPSIQSQRITRAIIRELLLYFTHTLDA